MSQVDISRYDIDALPIALALANRTHRARPDGSGWDRESLQGPQDLSALLDEHGWSYARDEIDEEQVEAARALREGLRHVFTQAGTDPHDAVRTLDRLLSQGVLHAGAALSSDGVRLELAADPRAPLMERLASALPLAVAQAAARHGLDRLRRCADAPATGEACPMVFIDTSRNGGRRFCQPRCANRTHVAAFRRRQQSEPDAVGDADLGQARGDDLGMPSK